MIRMKNLDNNSCLLEKRGISKGKKLCILLCTGITVFLCISWMSSIWWRNIEAQAHRMPACSKQDITSLIQEKRDLKENDYALLFQQTGLTSLAVDALFACGRQRELLTLQENLFAEVAVKCEANTIISREESIERVGALTRANIPYVENGDILISFNCHVLGWRNGHAAMVVDAKNRKTLEARVLGTDSKIMSMNHWEKYPSFVVLRLKGVTKEERADIAAYAAEHLVDVPYRLEAGLLERLNDRVKGLLKGKGKMDGTNSAITIKTEGLADISGTHCAHLVWAAYEAFGYDLDSDGGIVVTPRDIYESSLLELVQIYGM